MKTSDKFIHAASMLSESIKLYDEAVEELQNSIDRDFSGIDCKVGVASLQIEDVMSFFIGASLSYEMKTENKPR